MSKDEMLAKLDAVFSSAELNSIFEGEDRTAIVQAANELDLKARNMIRQVVYFSYRLAGFDHWGAVSGKNTCLAEIRDVLEKYYV